MTADTVTIMNEGMQCLTERMGVIKAERFISAIIREKFDYTKWQREYFDAMPSGEFHSRALKYAETHPYMGEAERL